MDSGSDRPLLRQAARGISFLIAIAAAVVAVASFMTVVFVVVMT